MRRPSDRQVYVMWCVVAVILIMGVAVALGTIVWSSG